MALTQDQIVTGLLVKRKADGALGKIVTVRTDTVKLQFSGNETREMPLALAVERLDLPKAHDGFEARCFENPEEVRMLCEQNPAEVLELLCRDAQNGSIDPVRVRPSIEPFLHSEWNRWWTRARTLAMRTGRFRLPEGSRRGLALRGQDVAVCCSSADASETAQGLFLQAMERLVRTLTASGAWGEPSLLAEACAILKHTLERPERLQPTDALIAAWLVDKRERGDTFLRKTLQVIGKAQWRDADWSRILALSPNDRAHLVKLVLTVLGQDGGAFASIALEKERSARTFSLMVEHALRAGIDVSKQLEATLAAPGNEAHVLQVLETVDTWVATGLDVRRLARTLFSVLVVRLETPEAGAVCRLVVRRPRALLGMFQQLSQANRNRLLKAILCSGQDATDIRTCLDGLAPLVQDDNIESLWQNTAVPQHVLPLLEDLRDVVFINTLDSRSLSSVEAWVERALSTLPNTANSGEVAPNRKHVLVVEESARILAICKSKGNVDKLALCLTTFRDRFVRIHGHRIVSLLKNGSYPDTAYGRMAVELLKYLHRYHCEELRERDTVSHSLQETVATTAAQLVSVRERENALQSQLTSLRDRWSRSLADQMVVAKSALLKRICQVVADLGDDTNVTVSARDALSVTVSRLRDILSSEGVTSMGTQGSIQAFDPVLHENLSGREVVGRKVRLLTEGFAYYRGDGTAVPILRAHVTVAEAQP